MQSDGPDQAAFSYTIVSLSIGLEETLKALAERNGNRPGPWLDEVEELALLRARGRLADAKDPDAVVAAIAVVQSIFARMRSGYEESSPA